MKKDKEVWVEFHTDYYYKPLFAKMKGKINEEGNAVLVFDKIPFSKEFTKSLEPIDIPEKPPIGIMPRKFWLKQRLDELRGAVHRYAKADLNIPVEWPEEIGMICIELRELS